MKRMFGWLMTVGMTGVFVSGLTGCKPSDAVKQAQVIGNGTRE
jgi:hypothetical protein